MKKGIISILFIYLSLNIKIYPQEVKIQKFTDDTSRIFIKAMYDSQGRLNGTYTEFYKNGKMKIQGEYSNNRKVGDFRYYYDNGQVKRKTKYKIIQGMSDSVKDSVSLPIENVFFYKNGELKSEGQISLEYKRINVVYFQVTKYMEEVEINRILLFVKKTGIWKYWNKEGELVDFEFYDVNTQQWINIDDIENPEKYYIENKMKK